MFMKVRGFYMLVGFWFFTLGEVAEPEVDLLHVETGPPAGAGRGKVISCSRGEGDALLGWTGHAWPVRLSQNGSGSPEITVLL